MGSSAGGSPGLLQRPSGWRRAQFNQERIVFAIAVAIFLVFSISLKGFLSAGNLLSLLQNVSILGILGVGMALVIIGRGIDLSMVATMVISVAWFVIMVNHDVPLWLSFALGLALALVVGLANGLLVAFAEIPAIFATLAMGTAVYGFGKCFLVETDVINLKECRFGWLPWTGGGQLFGVPAPVIRRRGARRGGVSVLTLHPPRPIHLCARRQSLPRPHHGYPDAHSAGCSIRAFRGNRVRGRGSRRLGRQRGQHPPSQFDADLRRHPRCRDRRGRAKRRQRRRAERHRRHLADRDRAERHDDPGCPLHAAEHHQEF